MIQKAIFITLCFYAISLFPSYHQKAFCSSHNPPTLPELSISKATLHKRKSRIVPKFNDPLAKHCSSEPSKNHSLEVPLLFYSHSAHGVQKPLKSNRAQSCSYRRSSFLYIQKKPLQMK